MKEELISFETAKLAKEKGFEYVGNIAYTKSGQNSIFTNSMSYIEYKYPINIVAQSLLQKWLREEHRIIVLIRTPFEQLVKFGYIYNIEELHGISVNYNTEDNFYNTYEEALEFGLKKALELIK